MIKTYQNRTYTRALNINSEQEQQLKRICKSSAWFYNKILKDKDENYFKIKGFAELCIGHKGDNEHKKCLRKYVTGRKIKIDGIEYLVEELPVGLKGKLDNGKDIQVINYVGPDSSIPEIKLNQGFLYRHYVTGKPDSFLKSSTINEVIKRWVLPAFKNYFKHNKGRPKFKKSHLQRSFPVHQNQVTIESDYEITLSGVPGIIKLFEGLKFPENTHVMKKCSSDEVHTHLSNATVVFDGRRWNIKFALENVPVTRTGVSGQNKSVGIDLNANRERAIQLSNGKTIAAPKPLRKFEKRLVRLSRSLSRKKSGGKNFNKLIGKLARLHSKIAAIRDDHNHKVSTRLANNYDEIRIEDLNIAGMVQGIKSVRKSILDNSHGRFKEYLTYKMIERGKALLEVDRFTPTSKLCSGCGFKFDNLTLSDRTIICKNSSCQFYNLERNRDLNAACNVAASGAVINLTDKVTHTHNQLKLNANLKKEKMKKSKKVEALANSGVSA